jgi:hypothetical protein
MKPLDPMIQQKNPMTQQQKARWLQNFWGLVAEGGIPQYCIDGKWNEVKTNMGPAMLSDFTKWRVVKPLEVLEEIKYQ